MKQKKENQTYLGQLAFKPELFKSLAGRYLQNIRLLIIIMAILIGLGLFSFFSVPKTLNPQVKIPLIIVNTILPGASPQEIESLVTIPLEKEISNLKGLTDYESSSRENVSVISLEFSSGIKPEDARNRVQAAVDKIDGLPEDAFAPSVQELDFENFPVIELALIKKNAPDDPASLNRMADKLKNKLENISTIDRLEISGQQNQGIEIFIKPAILREKNINPIEISSAIDQALKSYPAGRVLTGETSFSVSLKQPAQNIQQLREIDIPLGNTSYKLSDIATVSFRAKPEFFASYYANQQSPAQPAIVLSVYKTTASRLDLAGKDVHQALDEFKTNFDSNFETKIIYDYSQQINDQFQDLGRNFSQTFLLVFLSMLLLYGLKQALIASFAIPLSMLLIFIVMNLFEISLNFVSIFSILIALGLFVDNAVVIIEAYTSYFRTGKFTPKQTAILVWQDFIVQLYSINLLTVWAFLPLLVTSGIIGEFIFPIPIIVSVAMIGSATIAFLFTLPSMMILSNPVIPQRVKILTNFLAGLLGIAVISLFIPKTYLFIPTLFVCFLTLIILYLFRRQIIKKLKNLCSDCQLKQIDRLAKRSFNQGFISLEPLAKRYQIVIDKIFKSKSARIKILVIIISFTLFSYLLVPLGLVKNEFFPKSDQDLVYVQFDLPPGTNEKVTTRQTKKLVENLKTNENVDFVVGQVNQKASAGFSIVAPDTNNSLVTLVLAPENKRQQTSIEIAQSLRNDFVDYQKGKISVVEETSGPPAGADLQINILGNDLGKLFAYAEKIENFLNNQEGTTNIERSIKSGTSQLTFVPDKAKLKQYRINQQQIGFWLRTLVKGLEADSLNIDQKDYDIVIKFSQDLLNPEDLSVLKIPTQRGYASIEELGRIILQPNPTLITRKNGKREITITASVIPGYLPAELNQKLEKFAETDLGLEQDYEWTIGGINEENQKSVQSILEAMVISLFLIIATMVIQLSSFRRAIIVILVIPLAVSGVFTLFALTGTPLSFPALVGILALFGIVIANSLMIVDKVNQNLKAGLKFKQALTDASVSRLEPILLTTVSQIIGLIPITLSDPLWRGMGGAIIAGMSFSGLIMLLFIPVVYYYFFPKPKKNRNRLT